jgi:hypothetical protein
MPLTDLHSVEEGWNASAGQVGELPEQVSATSQLPAAVRHVVPELA